MTPRSNRRAQFPDRLTDAIDRQIGHARCEASAALLRLIIDLGKRLAIGLIGPDDALPAGGVVIDVRQTGIAVITRPIAVVVIIRSIAIIEPEVGTRREDAGKDERRTVRPKR